MKKFMTIPFLILAMLVFVSCVEEDDLEEGLSGDTTPADTAPAGDTEPSDTGDTTPAETGDTTPADTGDTTPGQDTTDSETGDTGTTPTPSPDPSCTPSCGGKECGDDGCGGSCGDCPASHTCNISTNLCMCTPSCAGKLCTDDDGCGGTCGCKSNEECNVETGACECIPSCDGKECGGDGCGGTCGGCAEDEVCIESTHTCKGCTKVTLAPVATLSKGGTGRYYKTVKNAYTPNTGDTSKEDKYVLSFTTSTTIETGKEINLAEFDSLKNCEEGMANNAICFIIGEDNDRSDGTNPAKTFFTQSGTLTIDEYNKSNSNIKFTLKGVKLGEMKHEDGGLIDGGDKDYFVTNGDCITVEDTTLTYPAE